MKNNDTHYRSNSTNTINGYKMINLIIGIFIGIVLAETGCVPLIQEYLIELLNIIKNQKEV